MKKQSTYTRDATASRWGRWDIKRWESKITENDYGARSVEVKRYSALFGDGPKVDCGPLYLTFPEEVSCYVVT